MFNYKKILNLGVLVVLGASIMVNCNSVGSTKDEPIEEAIVENQINNPDNPLDETGALHNEFLDFLVSDTGHEKVLGEERFLTLIEEFYQSNEQEFTRENSVAYSGLFGLFNEIGVVTPGWAELSGDLCKWFPILCDGGTTGPFNPFPDPVFTYLNDKNEGNSTERTLKFIEKVKNAEENIMNEEQIDGYKKEAQLRFYSVARYSSAYWHNVTAIQKEKSPYYEEAVEALEICGDCVVKADAAGAVVGAFTPGLDPVVTSAFFSAYAIWTQIR